MAARKRTSLRARASATTKTTPANNIKASKAQLPLPEDIYLTHPDRAGDSADSQPSEFLPDADDDVAGEEEWRLTKKDKRQMKRGLMLQRVRDAGITKDKTTKNSRTRKRRRPGNKLKTDLDGLADALPSVSSEDGRSSFPGKDEGNRREAVEEEEDNEEWEGISEEEDDEEMNNASGSSLRSSRRRRRPPPPRRSQVVVADGNIIRLQSLQHRPGAMKRKRRLEGREMERFARNLAQLADSSALQKTVESKGGDGSAGGVSAGEKWAALRRFIGSTMETADVFRKKGVVA